MNTEDTPKIPVAFNPVSGFEFHDLDGMFRAATCYLQSGFAPESFKTPQQLIICWARGAELGLRPLQAVEGLVVINNRITIMGDVALGMVRASGQLEDEPEVEYSGEGDSLTCTVTVKRKGSKRARSASFSMAEAKSAGLLDRPAGRGIPPWKAYPRRMLYYRPLGFVLRDTFSDVLKGMPITEEMRDIPTEEETMEAKVFAARAHTAKLVAEGVEILGAEQPMPTPAQMVEPAFDEDKTKTASEPAFSAQLAKDYPRVAAVAAGAEPKQEPEPKPEEQTHPALEPDMDLSFDPKPKPEPEPNWREHVIRSIPHAAYFGKKIGELSLKDLSRLENQWIPQVKPKLGDASDEQKLELPLFEAAIAHSKLAQLAP